MDFAANTVKHTDTFRTRRYLPNVLSEDPTQGLVEGFPMSKNYSNRGLKHYDIARANIPREYFEYPQDKSDEEDKSAENEAKLEE